MAILEAQWHEFHPPCQDCKSEKTDIISINISAIGGIQIEYFCPICESLTIWESTLEKCREKAQELDLLKATNLPKA